MLMMVVKRKTTLALVIPLLLCWLQGNTQSDDPEQPTEASPVLIHEIPINPNDVPEMIVSSSIPTASPSPLPMRCPPHKIFGISWSPDNIHMAVGIYSGKNESDCPYSGAVQIFDMSGNEPKLMHTLTDANDRVRDVTYNHDGTQLAAAAGNKVLVYDATDFNSAPTSLDDTTRSISSIAYNHDSTQLAVGDETSGFGTNVIRIYNGINPVSGIFNQVFTMSSSGLTGMAYNPDGNQLSVAIGVVRIFNVMTPSSPSFFRVLQNIASVVQSVIYNHNGIQLAVGNLQGTVRIYDGMNPTSDSFQELTDATRQINSIGYNPNDTRLAVGGRDDTVRIYNALNPASPPLHELTDARNNVQKVAYDHTGGLLAVGGDDQMLRIYQVVVPDSPTPSPVPSPTSSPVPSPTSSPVPSLVPSSTPSPTPSTVTQTQGSSGSVTTALSLTAFMAVFWAMVLP